jgi:electron transfer flavoprotein beta subunit
MTAPAPVLVALKWTPRADLADVEPSVEWVDDRFAGVSPADRAALEVALRLGATLQRGVVAVAVGPAGADAALRDALAVGATRAIRIDLPVGVGSFDVAEEIALVAKEASTGIVVCGDYSLDRGTGSVPAFVAHELGAAQALGLVQVDVVQVDVGQVDVGGTGAANATTLRAVRRLDGGRREALTVPTPCVVSVEGSVATLRRASLRAALASRHASVEVRDGGGMRHGPAVQVSAYRPRARVLSAPAGAQPLDRLRQLTDTAAAAARGEIVHLDPPAAAAAIVDRLRSWGYLDPPT